MKPQSGEISYQMKWKVLFTIFLAGSMLLCVFMVFWHTEELLSWLMLVFTVPVFSICIMMYWRYRFAYNSSTDMLSFRKGVQKEIQFSISEITKIHTKQEEKYIKGGRTVYDILCIQLDGQNLEIIYHIEFADFIAVSLDIENLVKYVQQKTCNVPEQSGTN